MTKPLSPKMQLVFNALLCGPQSAVELLSVIWGTGDGPAWERNDLRSLLCEMSKRLRARGLKIENVGPLPRQGRRAHRRTGAGRPAGRYRLVSVPATNTLPHKQLDPWGIAID